MFHFIYKGKFDCLISKGTFEMYIQNLYHSIKKHCGITYNPKKITITMETDETRKKNMSGTSGWTDFGKKYPDYEIVLHFFGYPKKEQTFDILNWFFEKIVTHELFHIFIPDILGNSCWTEGVTEFMMIWYNDIVNNTNTMREYNLELQHKYNEITDETYKAHRYGYITGFKKMAALYTKNPSVIEDIKKSMKERDYRKNYTDADIIAYNPKFKTFFTSRCNKHIPHVFT